jgi:hypothetical protein
MDHLTGINDTIQNICTESTAAIPTQGVAKIRYYYMCRASKKLLCGIKYLGKEVKQ